jgi:hypothetical protein
MLLLFVVQLFADCSTWPTWLRLGTYDCSPLEWLRWRALYVAVFFAFYALAGAGAIAVTASVGSRPGVANERGQVSGHSTAARTTGDVRGFLLLKVIRVVACRYD